jgi:epoxyqueuosine reductase QueG
MITSQTVKEYANALGADLCGIASVDRFADAPQGFHPKDVYPGAKSVISLACRVPSTSLDAKSYIPYTAIEDLVLTKVSQIAVSITLRVEDIGFHAVMIPSVPYDYWDEETLTGKGILSLKHLASKAGLGFIGKNALLCSPRYGNLIRLGAVITDVELQPDEIVSTGYCPDSCKLCIKSCPVGAIGENGEVQQAKCRPHSEIKNKRGVDVTVCFECRRVCPNRTGVRRK